MTLSKLNEIFEEAKTCGAKFIGVKIEMQDFPKAEIIINERENFQAKQDYYNKAYNEDLTLKTFNGIRIVGVAAGMTPMDGYTIISDVKAKPSLSDYILRYRICGPRPKGLPKFIEMMRFQDDHDAIIALLKWMGKVDTYAEPEVVERYIADIMEGGELWITSLLDEPKCARFRDYISRGGGEFRVWNSYELEINIWNGKLALCQLGENGYA